MKIANHTFEKVQKFLQIWVKIAQNIKLQLAQNYSTCGKNCLKYRKKNVYVIFR